MQRLLAIAFRLLYYEMAFTYDWVANLVSLGQWWKWQEQAFAFLPPGGRVLELGHGTGHMQNKLAKRGYLPFGIDLSPQMGHLAKRYLAGQGERAVACVRASALALPFPSASMPAMLATFPTNYIFQPPTLREIRRVLTPQGKLVVVLAAVPRPGGVLRTLARALFWLTGESPSQTATLPAEWQTAIENIYTHAGLHAELHTAELKDSWVWLVVVGAPVAG
jgi:ubiquinone/menaquinone biosynthesis C-methylase UbiE